MLLISCFDSIHAVAPLQDVAELEVAVGQNLYPLEHLGTPFRVLRAFR